MFSNVANSYSPSAKKRIIEYLGEIYRRRIIYNTMIKHNHCKDILFKVIHYVIASLTPLLIVIQNYTENQHLCSDHDEPTTLLALSVLVVVLLKIKDYVRFDKIKRVSREQVAKYKVLEGNIEAELRKLPLEKKKENDFIFWISREMEYIERDDPEIPAELNKQINELCASHGITVSNELTHLTTLERDVTVAIDYSAHIEIVNANVVNPNVVNANVVNANVVNAVLKDCKEQVQERAQERAQEEVQEEVQEQVHEEVQEQVHEDTAVKDCKEVKYIYDISPKDDLAGYKKEIENIKPSEDIEWCLDRLSQLK